MRDDFPQSVKRILAHRVGLHCSNPDCDADTSGPQADPLKTMNIGVAAHIAAAAPGGCRYDDSMTQKQRSSIENGIWLCQNCAKKVDNDPIAYPNQLLRAWKESAELNAKHRMGKARNISRSRNQSIRNVRRELKMRDDLHHLLLKPSDELRALPRFPNRFKKFRRNEVIIRRLGDQTYPETDDSPGISPWFKLEILDFYHNGIHGIVNIKYVLLDSVTRQWAFLTYEQSKEQFPPRFRVAKVFETGKIPWRNIQLYDMEGDEFYVEPKLHCEFADDGTPYEGFAYFLIGDGREEELRLENRTELSSMLEPT